MTARKLAWASTWVALAVLILAPFARLVTTGVPAVGGPLLAALYDPLRASLLTSGLAALGATVGGVAAALLTERLQIPGRKAFRLGFVGALLIPPFVSAVSWQAAYGPGGLGARLWGTGWVEGPLGIAAVIGVNALPLVYLITAAALTVTAEHDLEAAARSSGATPWTAFRTITWPLLKPAAFSGGVLAFVTGMNSFGIPMILGASQGFGTLTTEIYRGLRRSYGPDVFSEVVMMSVVLAVVTVSVVFLVDLGLPLVVPASTRARPTPVRRRGRGAVIGAILSGVYLLIAVAGPLVALFLRALTRAVGLPPTPANWTLANFAQLGGARASGALTRSLLLALITSTLVLALAAATNWLWRRGSRLPATLANSGFAIPGSALAVAVLLTYYPLLGNSLLLIVIAYLAKFWALGHRPLAASLERMGGDVVRAARSAGASAWVATRTVIAGVLWPALAAGWVIVFLFAVHELTMSSILHGPGTATLAVVVLDLQQVGDPMATAALALILTAIALVLGGLLVVLRQIWLRRQP